MTPDAEVNAIKQIGLVLHYLSIAEYQSQR